MANERPKQFGGMPRFGGASRASQLGIGLGKGAAGLGLGKGKPVKRHA